MDRIFLTPAHRRWLTIALLWSIVVGQVAAQSAAPALSGIEREIADRITIASIKDSTATLSSPEMEGRGTGQPGGDKAANWIADRFKALGLKPLGDKGSYLQRVEFKETVVSPDSMFKAGDETLVHGTDYAFLPMNNGSKDVSGDLVFVSYGIQARQADIDQLAGTNLMGKVVMLIEGPPPGFPKEKWAEQKASFAILQNLIRQGAAAIVFMTRGDEDRPAEMMIDYFSRRQITTPDEEGYPAFVPPLLYLSSKGAEKLFAKAGTTLKDAMAAAHTREFKSIELKQKAKIVARYKATKAAGSNVVGYLEGSDPQLRSEAVLFTAHYDAYGKDNGKVYHGAADNALGTAEMLAVAEAYSKLSQRPKRSMIFLAVTAEEYGLYGSKHWAKNPTWDIKKVAANLNLDGIGTEVYGPVKTMVGYGAEHSTLGPLLDEVARPLGISVIPDPMPDEKVFYRSDHYSFVERGVPALMLLGAPAGEKEVWIKRIKEWEKTDYHQPADVIRPEWSWEGAETVAEVMAIMGWRISETAEMPKWLSTGRFGKLKRGNTDKLPEEQK
ncbi:MAG: M28 family peptidase [Pyrinomonadaceae bacterium]